MGENSTTEEHFIGKVEVNCGFWEAFLTAWICCWDEKAVSQWTSQRTHAPSTTSHFLPKVT